MVHTLVQARLNHHQGGVQVALKDVKTGDVLDVLKGKGGHTPHSSALIDLWRST
jgi:hypothetical protein